MGIDDLSEEEKKLLLDELLKDVGKKRKRKRKRKPKTENPPQQQAQPNQTGWVPVNQIKRENKFDQIVKKIKIPNDKLWQESDKYDWEHREIDRASTRENNTGNLIEATCKVCQKQERVPIQLVQKDEGRIIYYCNRCAMGGSR